MQPSKPTSLPRFASLDDWAASTFYSVGERVVNDGGKIYQADRAGTSASSGGPTGTGSDIADGSARWDYIGATAPAWAGSTAYVDGDQVTNGGNIYLCVVGGMSAAAGGPSGTAVPAGFAGIVDGTVQWVYMAAATAVVTEPSTGQKDVGWIPRQRPPAQYLNWLLWLAYRWLLFLDGRYDVFGYRAYNPAVQFRENWLTYFSIDDTVAPAMAWPGSPWRVSGDQIAAGFLVESPPAGVGSNNFPVATIKPGTGAANKDAFIFTGGEDLSPAGVAGAGAFFAVGVAGTKFAMEWAAALSAVGANDTTYNMGLDDAAPPDNCYSNNLAVNDYAQFRKTSAQTTWRAVTCNGTTETVTDTGVTPTAGGYNLFRIEYDKDAASYKFYIDNVLVATHTTNLPSAVNLRAAFGGTRTAAASSFMTLGPVIASVNTF